MDPERLVARARWYDKYDRKRHPKHKARLERLLNRYRQKLSRARVKERQLQVLHNLDPVNPQPTLSLTRRIVQLQDYIILTQACLKRHYG